MVYLFKQLAKELFKNRISVLLAFLSVTCCSFMFFFVHFSVDGNLHDLEALSNLSEDLSAFQAGLISNRILAGNILAALTGLTGFIFAMFFYRFFRKNKRQLGCLKALGFGDKTLRGFFLLFTCAVSLAGGLAGLLAGRPASGLLIRAYEESYLAADLVKSIDPRSVATGLAVPAFVYCLITFCSYRMIQGREIGLLITGDGVLHDRAQSPGLSGRIADLFPSKKKFSLRLALQKPASVLLIFLSALIFLVMFLLAYSLTLSSATLFRSQTEGHRYLYETHFDSPVTEPGPDSHILAYLDTEGVISGEKNSVSQTVVGIERSNGPLVLTDRDKNILAAPAAHEIIISEALRELYNFHLGETVTVTAGTIRQELKISGVAFNAAWNCVYMEKQALAAMLGLPSDACTGIWSMEKLPLDGAVTTHEQRIDALRRSLVSNRSSALINQAIGAFVGCMLLYLALLLNFQDSTRDVLILSMMGYRSKEIHGMLINIYRPILWFAFLITLWPGIQIVKRVLRSLSLQIGDYMPFETNLPVILGIFAALNVIYFIVQKTFSFSIKKILEKETIADYTDS